MEVVHGPCTEGWKKMSRGKVQKLAEKPTMRTIGTKGILRAEMKMGKRLTTVIATSLEEGT